MKKQTRSGEASDDLYEASRTDSGYTSSRRDVLRASMGLGAIATGVGFTTGAAQSDEEARSPPENLTASTYPRTIEVDWEPPSDASGSEVFYYWVSVSGVDGRQLVSPETPSVRFEDLDPATDYTVEATAVYQAGESEPAVLETATTELRPPSDLTIASTAEGTDAFLQTPACEGTGLSIRWERPDAMATDGYEVYVDGEHQATVPADEFGPGENPNTVEQGFEYNTAYDVGVAASYGDLESETVTETVTTGGRPDPEVSEVRVDETTSTTATISWEATVECDIDRFDVYTNGDHTQEVDGDAREVTLTDLTPNDGYQIGVSAVAADGTESERATTVVRLDPDETGPSPPAGLEVTERRPTVVELAWEAATDEGGSDVCEYRVDVGSWPWTNEPADATGTGVGYLPMGWEGTIGVTAVDCAGNASERVTIQAETTSVDAAEDS